MSIVIIIGIVIALAAIAMLIGGHRAPAPKKANIKKVQQRLDSYPVLRSWVATWVNAKKGRAFFGNSLSSWEQGGLLHVEIRLRESDFSKVSLTGTFGEVLFKIEDMCNQ